MKKIYATPVHAMNSAWNIEALNGYKPQTTFWQDFSIADYYGEKAVRDTFQRAFGEWKNNHIYLTELVMVLNYKCWQHNDADDTIGSMLYEDLFMEASDYAEANLQGDDLAYYYQVTD